MGLNCIPLLISNGRYLGVVRAMRLANGTRDRGRTASAVGETKPTEENAVIPIRAVVFVDRSATTCMGQSAQSIAASAFFRLGSFCANPKMVGIVSIAQALVVS